MTHVLFNLKNIFRRPENLYLVLGLIFGILFVFTIPAFQVPDEGDHFLKAYALSELQILPSIRDDTCGFELPSALVRTIIPYTGISMNPEAQVPPGRIKLLMGLPLAPEQRRFCVTANASTFPPMAHLPAAFAIGIARHLKAPPILLMYTGRLATLFTILTLIYFTIRICPIHKWVIFLLGLMPMTVFLTASLSADALAIGSAFLLIAYIMRLTADNQPLTVKRLLIVSLLATWITLSKVLYFPLVLLLAVVHTQQFNTRSRKLWILALLGGLTTGIVITWSYLVSRQVEIINLSLGRSINLNAQVHFLLIHPFQYLLLIIRTFSAEGIIYIKSFIGFLGWLDTPLPLWIIISFSLMLILTAITDQNPRVYIRPVQRALFLTIIGIISLLLFTLLYTTWNVPESRIIEGFRGRYWIPISPLFFFCFYNHHAIGRKLRKYFPIVLPIFSFIILTATLYTLNKRYYVPNAGVFSPGLSAENKIYIKGGITRAGQLRQSFISPWPNLNGIEIQLCTFGAKIEESPYCVELYQEGIRTPIRRVELDSARIKDWQWYHIEFEPLPNSANTSYWFTIVPMTKDIRTPITVQLAQRGIYPEGQTWINGKETSRDVAFKLRFVPQTGW